MRALSAERIGHGRQRITEAGEQMFALQFTTQAYKLAVGQGVTGAIAITEQHIDWSRLHPFRLSCVAFLRRGGYSNRDLRFDVRFRGEVLPVEF